jgi:hypothetical protein
VPGHFQHRQHEGLVPGHGVERHPRADEIVPLDLFKQPRVKAPEMGRAPVLPLKVIRVRDLEGYRSGVPRGRRWPGLILTITAPPLLTHGGSEGETMPQVAYR